MADDTLDQIREKFSHDRFATAIFTLADFAIAVASNLGRVPTFSVSCNIEFLSVAKGHRLIATADVDREGHTLGFYTAVVTDELGTLVAKMTSVGYGK